MRMELGVWALGQPAASQPPLSRWEPEQCHYLPLQWGEQCPALALTAVRCSNTSRTQRRRHRGRAREPRGRLAASEHKVPERGLWVQKASLLWTEAARVPRQADLSLVAASHFQQKRNHFPTSVFEAPGLRGGQAPFRSPFSPHFCRNAEARAGASHLRSCGG